MGTLGWIFAFVLYVLGFIMSACTTDQEYRRQPSRSELLECIFWPGVMLVAFCAGCMDYIREIRDSR
jgi:hypothetical protein